MSLVDFQDRVCTRIWTQFIQPEDSNVVGVGFGIGVKADSIDLQRPVVLRLYVLEKRAKRSRKKNRPLSEIDPLVNVGLFEPNDQLFLATDNSRSHDLHGRPLTGGTIQLPTDVMQVGKIVSSGALVSVHRDPSIVTAGVVVRWRQWLSPSILRWGIVTVAHGFDPPIDPSVAIDSQILNPVDGRVFHGKRIVQFRPPLRGYDTVLIGVRMSDLLDHGLIVSEHTPPIIPASYSSIGLSRGTVGIAYQRARFVGFTVIGNVSPLNVEGVGSVDRMMHVRSEAKDAFVETTSGSVYAIADPDTHNLIPAAIQIGADASTDFRDGFGQCLSDVLSHLATELSRRLSPLRDSIVDSELQLASYF